MQSVPTSAQSASVVATPGPYGARGYSLNSDLAQFCLPAASRDANRKLAYANSICILFLAIGIAGLNPPRLEQRVPEAVQEFIPVDIVQQLEPPKTEQQQPEEQPDKQPDTTVEMPQIATVVAADPSQVTFSVPVQGPVVFAPAKLAQAPPAAPPKPTTRTVIKMTGDEGGSFPALNRYPQAALEQRQQGTVTLIIGVKPDGSVESIEVKTGSGYGTLDRAAIQHVKTRYKFLPISTEETRYFEKDFVFRLQ